MKEEDKPQATGSVSLSAAWSEGALGSSSARGTGALDPSRREGKGDGSLLLKALLGTLTSEEGEELRAWREADAENERLYQQTIDPAFLQHEYAKRQSVNYARPLSAMEARIGTRGRKSGLRPFLWGAAASLAVVLLAGALAYLYLYHRPIEDIQPGGMRAMITYPDGQMMALTAPLSSIPDRPGAASSRDGGVRADSIEDGSSAAFPPTGEEGEVLAISLTTPRGGEFSVTLEDGTEVWLNAQSRLVYPETFAGAERRVQVEGEAYFRVSRDAHRPFLVETDGQLVRVLGTEFNVRSYAEDETVQTTLVRGSIAMQPVGAGTAQLLLTPGHQAVFDKNVHDIKVRSVDTEVVTSWKDGKFVFEHQTLEQIMLTLARWYDFSYRFADRRAAQTEFMGSIPRYADFTDVIAILESSGGLRLSVKGRNVTIESKHN